MREWLADDEQAALPARGPARDLAVLGCWTGKEASARRSEKGCASTCAMRWSPPTWLLATRFLDGAGWSPLRVTWRTERVEHWGWWRHDDRTVIAVVADPPAGPPVVA